MLIQAGKIGLINHDQQAKGKYLPTMCMSAQHQVTTLTLK